MIDLEHILSASTHYKELVLLIFYGYTVRNVKVYRAAYCAC